MALNCPAFRESHMGYNETQSTERIIMKLTPNEIKFAIGAVAWCVPVAAIVRRKLREEKASRNRDEERKQNLRLDLLAIKAASEQMTANVRDGKYKDKYLHDLENDFYNEIKFQSIAIREEPNL